jgi:RNA binding exosome subunit
MQVVSAQVSAIVHATEDLEKVMFALNRICSQGLLQPRIEKKVLKGHFGNEITTLTLSIRGRSAESFFANLWNKLSRIDRSTVIHELGNRFDKDDRLHLRLDKQECFRQIVQIRDQDAIKVQVSIRDVLDPTKDIRGFLESITDSPALV